jgi:helicase
MEKEEIIKKVLKLNGFFSLNPVQKEAIEKGTLEKKNLIVASPTSSGKTLIAELAGLNISLNEKKKMVYLCPLVALAREKYENFKKYEKLGLKIALSVGNFDSDDPWLSRRDWIICSNEKMDSLIRHGAEWIKDIGLIVADEIHLIDDPSRGPTLEILLTILREILPKAQILALSATIKNSDEIGEWLGAEVIKSDFRPVKLYFGIAGDGKIKVFGKKIYEIFPGPIEEAISENTLLLKKQLIFFLSTRRNAESLAERLSKFVPHYLSLEEKNDLEKLARKIFGALSSPTGQCQKLANCIKNGVAFYHSGLVFSQKALIEEAYKKGLIKAITSTTALALGLNLPNFRAVVRDIKRYQPGLGSIYLPVLEVQQMFGRSGRPQFDQWGEGILIAKKREEEEELKEHYIEGELEEIESKISSESSLRMHILSLISNRFCSSEKSLLEFFLKTFFGFKFKNTFFLAEKVKRILELFEDWDFIKSVEVSTNGETELRYFPTRLGKRISELYIDPLSAIYFIEGLKKAIFNFSDFTLLHLLCSSIELEPGLNLSLKDIPEIEEKIAQNEEEFLVEIPDQFDEEYEEFLKEVKLALAFFSWINEEKEDEILKKYNLAPGELHSRLEISDWLCYSILEIGKILKIPKEIKREIRKLRMRLNFGIKEELLPLVRLKGIGRVRARLLFNSGIDKISKIKKVSQKELAKILKSQKLAKKLKEEIK